MSGEARKRGADKDRRRGEDAGLSLANNPAAGNQTRGVHGEISART